LRTDAGVAGHLIAIRRSARQFPFCGAGRSPAVSVECPQPGRSSGHTSASQSPERLSAVAVADRAAVPVRLGARATVEVKARYCGPAGGGRRRDWNDPSASYHAGGTAARRETDETIIPSEQGTRNAVSTGPSSAFQRLPFNVCLSTRHAGGIADGKRQATSSHLPFVLTRYFTC
jgi:hypothetical protein